MMIPKGNDVVEFIHVPLLEDVILQPELFRFASEVGFARIGFALKVAFLGLTL